MTLPTFQRALCTTLLAVAVGCGSGDQTEPPSHDFPAEPLTTLPSVSGGLTVELRTAPSQPPQRGTVAMELRVKNAAGGAEDGLALTVTPWMAAMGHGSSVRPRVQGIGGGRYLVDEVQLFMPGHWELRTSIDGALPDSVTAAFDVP